MIFKQKLIYVFMTAHEVVYTSTIFGSVFVKHVLYFVVIAAHLNALKYLLLKSCYNAAWSDFA